MAAHFQCRLAKRLDGKKVVTSQKLLPMYPHDQKTLKGYHTLDGAVAAALHYNQDLPRDAVGIVITRHTPSSRLRYYPTPSGRTDLRKEGRKAGTTEWLLLVDRDGAHFELEPNTHRVLGPA